MLFVRFLGGRMTHNCDGNTVLAANLDHCTCYLSRSSDFQRVLRDGTWEVVILRRNLWELKAVVFFEQQRNHEVMQGVQSWNSRFPCKTLPECDHVWCYSYSRKICVSLAAEQRLRTGSIVAAFRSRSIHICRHMFILNIASFVSCTLVSFNRTCWFLPWYDDTHFLYWGAPVWSSLLMVESRSHPFALESMWPTSFAILRCILTTRKVPGLHTFYYRLLAFKRTTLTIVHQTSRAQYLGVAICPYVSSYIAKLAAFNLYNFSALF